MAKKRSLLADKITGDNIYKALVFFDKLYAQMNEAEKREFLSQLVDNVQIYEERKENGQWLKSIEFKLPIIEKEFTLSLDNDTQNETVVLMSTQRNKDQLPGRDGEIRQLNSLRVYGQSEVRADGLCRSWAFFTVSTVETVAESSNVKVPCIIWMLIRQKFRETDEEACLKKEGMKKQERKKETWQ